MELRDLIVTPIILFLIYGVAFGIRSSVTDEVNRVYFIPALTVKIIGALALGFIYQFYYSGGDTFTYHTHGSRPLWEALIETPANGIKAFFYHGTYGAGLWDIAEKIWYWRNSSSFFIIQIAAIFDLITFSTYSATAVLFSVLSFVGGWMLYLTFYASYPKAYRILAYSCLFVPSVIFWGSGILKDTVTLAFVGISTYCVSRLIIDGKISTLNVLLLIVSFYVIFSVKKYILISLVAGIIVWVASNYLFRIRSIVSRLLLIPTITVLCIVLSYIIINNIMGDDSRYSLDRIAKTSMITAHDIRYGWGARAGDGSGYTLGKLDGTWQSMITLAPAALNVSLFRPYFWEVKNPLMALSSLEALLTLCFTVYVLFTVRANIFKYIKAEIIFCLVFVIIFAVGVGVSTFNFGTLSRYKIPLLPFYWSMLAIIYSSWKEDKILRLQN
ncbi:MAG: hypothetical protein U5K54_10385 [Cytophagales bacterium]|nr:hypothetical protein [Cytophagales bacterium]